jgi:DNA-directed RNA polymerase subunit RPC12/RpoP
MFGVIVCSRCHKVRGIDLATKRTVCPGCGHSMYVSRAKIYFETEDLKELGEAVRQKAKEISPKLDENEAESWSVGAEKEASTIPKLDEQGLLTVALRLSKEMGEFSKEDLMNELGLEGEENISELLEKMQLEGLIYEPEPGKYRAI